ncbi:hypothetical protein R1sor_004699 [Riccia sorocarpa]|uniref:Uncharacterized protein n=1 Tax=Riccia sorocarpa TaxID=122646 RepID=A0ABD3HI16_9MARC
MHRVKLVPIRTTYVVQPPFPKEVTINQLLDVERPPLEFRTADVSEHYGSVGIINSKWTEERQDWYLNGLDFVCIRKLKRGRQSVAGPFKLVRKEGDFVILEAADKSHFSHLSFMKKTSSESTQFRSDSSMDVEPRNICICKSIFGDGFSECVCGYQRTSDNPQTAGQNETEDDTGDDDGSEEHSGNPNKPPAPQKPNKPAMSPSKDKVKLKAKAAAGPSKPTKKPRTVAAKDLDLSITVEIADEDVSGETFDKLAQFIDKNTKMGIISFERGDAHLLLHIQGMISIKSSSTKMVKTQIRQAI